MAFGKQISLVGYDVESISQRLALTLYWKRSAPIAADYTVFVHVLDANGKIVAQDDHQPGDGMNPTSLWDDGEVVADNFALEVPPGTGYLVDLGWYLPGTGERLTVTDRNGQEIGDHLELGPFEVGQ